MRVSINVAARELGEAGFDERIARTLEAAGVAPERIALEITETTLMEGGEAGIAGLEALSRLGVQVYLDDFGTGYSSLTRLARLPLAGIKLDRGFVVRAAGERDRRIIEAALSIGRAAELRSSPRASRPRTSSSCCARAAAARAGLPARAARAARAGGGTAHWMSCVSCRYSLATSAGSFLSRSTRASSSCIASSVSDFWIRSIVFARSGPAASAVSCFITSVGL